MSGFDKYLLEQKLLSLGWTIAEDGELIPPAGLWENRPKINHVYEAVALHECLTIEPLDEGGG